MEKIDETKEDLPRPPSYCHISVEERDGALVVRFIDLKRDLGGFDAFQAIVHEFRGLATHHHCHPVVLDLGGQDVGKTAIFYSVLVRLFRIVKQAEGTLKLCNLSPPVVEEMKAIRLTMMFSIYASLEDALAGTNIP